MFQYFNSRLAGLTLLSHSQVHSPSHTCVLHSDDSSYLRSSRWGHPPLLADITHAPSHQWCTRRAARFGNPRGTRFVKHWRFGNPWGQIDLPAERIVSHRSLGITSWSSPRFFVGRIVSRWGNSFVHPSHPAPIVIVIFNYKYSLFVVKSILQFYPSSLLVSRPRCLLTPATLLMPLKLRSNLLSLVYYPAHETRHLNLFSKKLFYC